MRRPDLRSGRGAAAAAVVLVAALASFPAMPKTGDGPYVVGSDDDPRLLPEGADPGPALAEFALLRSHTCSDRFAVESVAVSPDGTSVAAVSRVSRQGPMAWESSSGRPLALPPLAGNAAVLAWSHDGRQVAVAVRGDVLAGDPGGVDLLDLESGRGPRLAGGDEALDLAFSPDDRFLVAATPDGLIGWDVGGREPALLSRIPGGADMVAFVSPVEVMVGGGGGAVLLRISLEDGLVVDSWEGRAGRAACVSPDGRLVAVGGTGEIRVLDLQAGGPAQVVPLTGEVSALDWGEGGRILAAGTATGQALVFGTGGVGALAGGTGPGRLAGLPQETDRGAPRAGRDRQDRGDEPPRAGGKAAAGRGEARGDEREAAGRTWGEPLGRDVSDDGAGSRDDPFERRRDDDDAVTARPAEEPKTEIVAAVEILVLGTFGNDPRTARDLERSLAENLRRLEPCWKREARKGADVTGKLILPMSVTAEGEGIGFGDPVREGFPSDKALRCTRERLRENLFPPGLGSMEIELTLVLDEVVVP